IKPTADDHAEAALTAAFVVIDLILVVEPRHSHQAPRPDGAHRKLAAAVEVEHRDSEIVVACRAAILLGHFIPAPGVAGTDREPVEQRVLRVQPDAASLVVALAAGEAGYGVTAGDIVEPIERRQRVVRAEPEAVEKRVSTRELARLPGQVDRCGLAPGHHADR